MGKLKRKMNDFEKKLWHKFHIPNTGNLNTLPVNVPYISGANTWNHESCKLKKAYECLKACHAWIMEAQENKTGRIRDFVCLSEGIIWEWESLKSHWKTKDSENAYDSPNCIVEVIKLWEL